MSRHSYAKMASEVGQSMEAKIAALIATSFTNNQIFDLLASSERQECLSNNDARRNGNNYPSFNKISAQRLHEQIRSIRCLMKNESEDTSALFESTGCGGQIIGINDIELENIKRYPCGIPAFDYLYGETHYIHTNGPDRGKPTGYIEHGMPASFLSIWPGEPGVGKSRTAISLLKSINSYCKQVGIYYNGEAHQSQFRAWCGTDVDNDLFKVRSAEIITLDQIVMDCYKFKPRLIVIDSAQTIAGWNNGSKSVLRLLSRLKLLKMEKDAGLSHIILISQLNKKKELKGSNDIPHMVDFVAKITRVVGRKDHFFIECPTKNRGGPSGRGIEFKHTISGVECVSTNYSVGPIFKLKQISEPINDVVYQSKNENIESVESENVESVESENVEYN
jgi:hypothetical protein